MLGGARWWVGCGDICGVGGCGDLNAHLNFLEKMTLDFAFSATVNRATTIRATGARTHMRRGYIPMGVCKNNPGLIYVQIFRAVVL
jgi:hypothetical protein